MTNPGRRGSARTKPFIDCIGFLSGGPRRIFSSEKLEDNPQHGEHIRGILINPNPSLGFGSNDSERMKCKAEEAFLK